MKIQGKLILGFGLQLTLVAGAAAAGLLGLRSVQGSFQSAIEHGLLTERLAGEMRHELLEARRAEKDFLLRWRAEGFLPAHERYVAVNQRHVARIRQIVATLEALDGSGGPVDADHAIREDLIALKPYVNVYAEDFRAAVGLIRALGSSDRTPARERAMQAEISARIEDFQSSAGVVEPLVVDIAMRGQQDAAAQIKAAQSASRRTVLLVGASCVVAMLTALGLASLLGRQIRTPLRNLARTAEAVGAGDLTAQAQVTSRDEIGTLATTFNAMTGQLRGLVATLEQRVAERKRAEEALRASQQLLENVIDNSPAIIFVKDLAGRYLLINRRFEELFQVTEDNAVGKTDYELFPKTWADVFLASDRRALLAGRPTESEETTLHPDGLHTFITVKCPLRAEEGKPYAVCGISTDVTHLKQMEEQVRQSQKMEAIGRLAGGIAHDFNNLLTAINGYSALALQQLDPRQELHQFVSEILHSGNRAAGLTRQLLAYSRKQQLAPRLWDLNVIVCELEGMLERLIGEDIRLEHQLSPEPALVKVDRGQVEQILLNLVVNARDAMPQGGTLLVQTAAVVLDAAFAAMHPEVSAGPHVMLAVTDTGTGMSPEVMSRIFEPFFTTKEVGKGTGLGLSVAYGIVKQSGGAISASSEGGRGTTFRIYLPRAEAAAGERGSGDQAAPPPRVSEPDPYRGTETVLLVEDEDLVRMFACHALEAKGYRVLLAKNGREAQRAVEQAGMAVDLVITDVVMPELGGRELAAQLHASRPDLRVLFMSGYSDAEGEHEPPKRDEDLLPKPFAPTELARKVREVLDRRPAGVVAAAAAGGDPNSSTGGVG
jgi:PAS domain S-box-containing protein